VTPPAQHPGCPAVQLSVATLQSTPVQPTSQKHWPLAAAQLPWPPQPAALTQAKALHAWLSGGVHPSWLAHTCTRLLFYPLASSSL